jgi:urease accessory protein
LTIRRLVRASPAGSWPADAAVDGLTLGFLDRNRRRIRLATDSGETVLLDLPQTAALAEGDGLEFEDGGWLAVRAAAEDVLEIEASDACHLARLAWHLGNRHLPVEVVSARRLRVAYDHVIEAMLEGLGARSERRLSPFQPESGAYAGEHRHG